jgi:hypothetical protein
MNTVFLLILKRDRDRCVHERSHKNDRQCDILSLSSSLSILVKTLMDATVTVTLQNHKKHSSILELGIKGLPSFFTVVKSRFI